MTRVLLYTPANLNIIDGSAIWVQAVAETLHTRPDIDVTIPLREPERRDVITGLLRRLDRVTLVPPGRKGLTPESALDAIERLDGTAPFDVLLIRSFAVCRIAVERASLRGRLWSTYVLEPERDPADPEHLADLDRIARGSRLLVSQSDEMRRLTEELVPAAAGRVILLPPAVPDVPRHRVDPARPTPRLIYSGKFHPFYPIEDLVGAFTSLRSEVAGLEFHVLGDKITNDPTAPDYAPRIRRLLESTPGVVWHGAVSRDAVEAFLAQGGVGLSVWDYRYGSRMNDLVVSTKLLDYASVGLPAVVNRTAAQERILGPDYPLFADEARAGVERAVAILRDPSGYRAVSERMYRAARAFGYSAVRARIDPSLDAATAGEDLRPAGR